MTPKAGPPTAKKSADGPVYSTAYGRMCPDCRQPSAACRCRRAAQPPLGDGIVRVGRETKGRKGRGVTTISGIALDQDGLKKLVRKLKQQCGTGGSVKNGIIEIQGDHRDKLVEILQKDGWTVKRSGG